jgi:2',3'-cyclic-nucleotide 2'-phosphodiesterase (5'-nucleotidase family)
MKRLFFPILATLLLVASCKKEPIEPQKERSSIVILYENDVHCAIEGYAPMAGLRDAISDTAYVGLVSVGDYFQGGNVGAISKGGYIMDIMSRMNYDAVTLGNHEFDYGVPRLIELMTRFNAPILCANLYDMAGNHLCATHTLCTYGSKQVAYVGVLTSRTMESEEYAFFEDGEQIYDLRTTDVAQLVQIAVDEARAEGADYVILLSHLGEYPNGEHINSHELVAATTGIDVVLDGHSHSVVLCDTVDNLYGQPVYITQTGTKFQNVGQLVITKDGDFQFSLIPTASIPYTNADVARTVDSVQVLVDEATSQVAFHSDYCLTIYDEDGHRLIRRGETNAGDIMTDAYRYVADADLGFNNGGGYRTDIPAGDVTVGQIIDMIPFDNHIVKIVATGAQILNMLQQCTANLPTEDGEFPQVSGMRFTVRVSDHSITNAEVQQYDGSYEPLDPEAIYTIGTTDYCAYNGGLHGTLSDCTVLEILPITCYEPLGIYINEVFDGIVPPQYTSPQGRIIVDER